MKAKKLLAIFITIILMLTLITGCKKENLKITDETVELTVWAIASNECSDYSTNKQSEWYYNQTNVKINWITVPAQGWADSFQRSVMSGEWPDIYLYDFSTEEVQACVEYGAIIPLNNLIEENCPNIKSWIDGDKKLKEIITSPDGNIYTLFADSYNIDEYRQKLWVNKEWLSDYTDKTGNTLPTTTSEFEEMLKFFKENDMNNNGDKTDEIPYLGVNGRDGMSTLISAFTPTSFSSNAFGCYNNNGKIEFTLNNDEFREGIEYLNGLYRQGLITDKTFTTSSEELYEYVGTDRENSIVGVVVGGDISSFVKADSSDSNYDYDDFIAIPPLKGPDGFSSYVISDQTIALKNAITTSCKNPEIAAKWLDYWFSEEGRLWSVNGGQEGVQWWYEEGTSIKGEGKIVTKTSDSSLLENACWGTQGVSFMIKPSDFELMNIKNLNKNSSLATYIANEEYKKVSVTNSWTGVVWATEDLKEAAIEYSEITSLLKDHGNEYYTAFIMGNKDITDDKEWEEYCNKYYELGLDRYIELVELCCNS